MILTKTWISNLPLHLISDAARDVGIPWTLLASIVQTESGGNPLAARFEQDYKWVVKTKDFARDNGISEITELVFQKTSWGLCQLMGGLLRDSLGHKGSLLECLDAELNLKYGATHLLNLGKRFSNRSDLIAAYNAGSPVKSIDGKYRNQAYVDKVTSFFNNLNETFDYKP